MDALIELDAGAVESDGGKAKRLGLLVEVIRESQSFREDE